MNKIAIDVVLLPSESMAATAVAVSSKLAETSGNTKIILDAQRCLPHISLCMGVVDEGDLPQITALLHEMAHDLPPFKLTSPGISGVDIPTGEKLALIQVTNTPDLQNLHDTIMEKLRGVLAYEPDASMYFNPSEIEPISFQWTKSYANDVHVFRPHITAGFGPSDTAGFPIDFTASTLAICQLGNYCTCRKVLATLDLESGQATSL